MMADDPGERLTCATYTHARRHPMVIGQIAGWTPPFQLTPTQIVVLVVTVLVESQTWRWWGPHLPRPTAVLVAIALPCTFTWLVRRGRLEGRNVVRTAAGWLQLWARPRGGRVAGRPYRPARPRLLPRAPVFVACPVAQQAQATSTRSPGAGAPVAYGPPAAFREDRR